MVLKVFFFAYLNFLRVPLLHDGEVVEAGVHMLSNIVETDYHLPILLVLLGVPQSTKLSGWEER